MMGSHMTSVLHDLLSGEFDRICNGFCCIYEDFKQDLRLQAFHNDENQLRNFLIDKPHLGSRAVREKLNLGKYHFVPEGYLLDKQSFPTGGRCDIKVILMEYAMQLDEDPSFLFECKRLDGTAKLAAKYVIEGIQRFTTTMKYPALIGRAGMIGFLVQPVNTSSEINRINQKISKTPSSGSQILPMVQGSHPGFEGAYFSEHLCTDNSNLHLRHFIYSLV
jgi:hypothetical protein